MMRSSNGARERPSEHHMMTFSARSYNQRFTVLNTHQCLTTVQMRYHSYARESFGDAVMAKCGHKNAQTPYSCVRTPARSVPESRVLAVCGDGIMLMVFLIT